MVDTVVKDDELFFLTHLHPCIVGGPPGEIDCSSAELIVADFPIVGKFHLL